MLIFVLLTVLTVLLIQEPAKKPAAKLLAQVVSNMGIW
jgi:hypothetical protein